MVAQLKKIGSSLARASTSAKPILPFKGAGCSTGGSSAAHAMGNCNAGARCERLVMNTNTMGVYGHYYLKRAKWA
jgi:hypothetical protein